jgi:hypothetical protein
MEAAEKLTQQGWHEHARKKILPKYNKAKFTGIGRFSPSDFPDLMPPEGKTHLVGRYTRDDRDQSGWKNYQPLIKRDQLPSNVARNPNHWVGGPVPGQAEEGPDLIDLCLVS